jgi:hypothetical protein
MVLIGEWITVVIDGMGRSCHPWENLGNSAAIPWQNQLPEDTL